MYIENEKAKTITLHAVKVLTFSKEVIWSTIERRRERDSNCRLNVYFYGFSFVSLIQSVWLVREKSIAFIGPAEYLIIFIEDSSKRRILLELGP